jgi:hypothetical protein
MPRQIRFRSQWVSTIIAVVLVMFSAINSIAQQDQCKDILAGGVRNTIKMSATASEAASTGDWFCSDNFTSYISNQSAGFGLKIPIDGVPVEFKGASDNSQSMTQRNQYCGKANRQFSQQNAMSVWRQIADTNIVQAWVDCMKVRGNPGGVAQGVQLSLADIGGGIVVVVGKFQPAFNGQPAPIVYSFDVTGLSCSSNRLSSGAELAFQGLAETCTRVGNSDAVAIVLTDQGYATAKLFAALDGKDAGTAVVSVVGLRKQWNPIEQRSANTGTADHDQTGNHDPKRFPYRVELPTLPPEQNYRNPRVSCSGIGCPWSRALGDPIIDQAGRHVYLDFECWGRPTTYTLVVDVFQNQDVVETVPDINLTLKYGRTFSFTIPKAHRTAFLNVSLGNGKNVIVNLDAPAVAGGEVVIQSKQEVGDRIAFTFEVPVPGGA